MYQGEKGTLLCVCDTYLNASETHPQLARKPHETHPTAVPTQRYARKLFSTITYLDVPEGLLQLLLAAAANDEHSVARVPTQLRQPFQHSPAGPQLQRLSQE